MLEPRCCKSESGDSHTLGGTSWMLAPVDN
ncbi:hypothetical protein ABID22_000939 [Pontibacter aydingkolensis]